MKNHDLLQLPPQQQYSFVNAVQQVASPNSYKYSNSQIQQAPLSQLSPFDNTESIIIQQQPIKMVQNQNIVTQTAQYQPISQMNQQSRNTLGYQNL